MVTPQQPDVIVFDMDGVLVEVGASYREAIRETVGHFTGHLASHDAIQDLKNAGGWNNDWLLSHRLISDQGVKVEYEAVVDFFNQIFFGENGNGLMRHERWMPTDDLLTRLAGHASLAIFTGRAKYEADTTLLRYAPSIRFEPIITDESVANSKPAPDGLELIKQHYPGKQIWFLGDTVDDARSARAAGVPFVGVSMKSNPRYADITETLYADGAFTVLDDVNELAALVDVAVLGRVLVK